MKKLVSAIYLNFNQTTKGGRPYVWRDRYIDGVANLRNNKYKKVIYTDGDQKILGQLNSKLNSVCSKDELNLFEIKTLDIDECEFSSRLDQLMPKEKKRPLDQRCPHVQYAKIDFIKRESIDSEFTFWIDAGLISPNLFPRRLVPHSETEVITDDYLSLLESRIKDKLYFICGDRQGGFSGPTLKGYRYHPVGGFFGGSKPACDSLYSKYKSISLKFLEEGKVHPEQIIMEEMLLADNSSEDPFILFDSFDSWYHEDHMIKEGARIKNKKFHQVFKD
jgi:hypothetical protein